MTLREEIEEKIREKLREPVLNTTEIKELAEACAELEKNDWLKNAWDKMNSMSGFGGNYIPPDSSKGPSDVHNITNTGAMVDSPDILRGTFAYNGPGPEAHFDETECDCDVCRI